MANPSTKQTKVDELVDEFRTSGNQDRAFDNLAAARLGVNLTDLHCLNIIERSGGLTASALAAQAGLTSGAITGVIDRLERAGYARRERDAGDRRRVMIAVTPAFYAAADQIWGPLRADWDTVITRRFTAQQLDTVIAFLRTANDLARRHMDRVRDETPAPAAAAARRGR
jgi:DNA-binding MarR family transcriptional regulator